MAQAVGTVARVNGKQLDSGLWYSLCIDDVWYRTGKTKPKCQEGNKVRFTFTEDQWGKHVDLGTLEVKEGEASSTAGAAKVSGKAPASSSDFWANKEIRDIETQKRISYQAATNTAINLVSEALEREFLGVPKSKKPAEKMDLYLEMVKTVAEDVYRTYQLLPELHEGIMSAGAPQEAVEDDFVEDAEVETDASDDSDW